ncbi:unnamed protein product [Phaedon cochleariae]|uniref:Conserved oligomeric Golgi complex subunit 1 n=1 Tax=Phaedon cochleariae TaxID=80249 RepID=A0A9P0DUE7_PHACE|nr:unnamed protein product [Phaedon cochleariae]
MAKKQDLLELDIDKAFEERSIDEIIEIEKLLDAEIERKRNELRSMVGDRYKDVLAASDAIKSMKTISQLIVNSIEKVMSTCEEFINPVSTDIHTPLEVEKEQVDERTVIIQIRMAIFMNEQIWIAIDEENNLEATQYYLLAQHIHTGLSLSKNKYLDKIPLLHQIKSNLVVLRSRIFHKIVEKLESVDTSAQETSQNLNALLLLEKQTSSDLLSIFIEHRKTALNTVMHTSYSSVRMQISSMVKCLITTVRLLHDCFICSLNQQKGLIWQQLEEIVGGSSTTTLSKLQLPVTPLISYIPEVIRNFRPTFKYSVETETSLNDAETVLKSWLESTRKTLETGLEKSLELVTNVKGLHLIREESLKLEPPENWEQICKDSHLPENFDVWYCFFQNLITNSCQILISKKISLVSQEIQSYIKDRLNNISKDERSGTSLIWYTWKEEPSDVGKAEDAHSGLSMKHRGFSPTIVDLCYKLDTKYFEILEDVWQYLYGKEYGSNDDFSLVLKDYKFKRKYIDTPDTENHLQAECAETSLQLSNFIRDHINQNSDNLVTKSIICARFLQAATQLCPNFNKCCMFNNSTMDWSKICDTFNKTSHTLWLNWVQDIVKTTEKQCEVLDDISLKNMLKVLGRWDEIEIQEQTDEKVFKSQIKVPLKPSLALSEIFANLNEELCCILPHTLPKLVHVQYIEDNVNVILRKYKQLSDKELNQKQALQLLFDVKYLTTFCIPRENVQLIELSQDICDKLRSRIDPFDLDVFYSYLQNNVKKAVIQSQIMFGCLLPSPGQLSCLGVSEKLNEQDQNPSILALSVPSSTTWFPLLPVSAPSQKLSGTPSKNIKESTQKPKATLKKSQDSASMMRQSAASLFGGLTNDWFS